MGTDYDSWLLNIVEGDSEELCEEDEGPDPQDVLEQRERDRQADWEHWAKNQ
jgi:hypothetical protein